jgi:hypothetical protein
MKNSKSQIPKSKSFTLVDVLVGIFLMLLFFLGIAAAYQLGFKIVGLNERKITATQIAQGEIEKMRNMPYLEIGTKGASLPSASGTLDSITTTTLNGIEYKIERSVKFVVDSADGNFPDDNCDWDYKRAEINVSWSGQFPGKVNLISDFSPKDKIEEVQTCQEQPGGILSVLVFDAFGLPVPSPLIQVFDPSTGLLITSATPSDGKHDFPLASSTYKVLVSKSGYSSERTYSIEEVAVPQKPNPTVLEGQVTQISFSIDKVSSILVKTLTPWGQDFFSDSFNDESKISQKENVLVGGGKVNLATDTQGYLPSGYLFSIQISPTNLIKWDKFSFTDQKSLQTSLKYQIYFASGTDWYLTPDSDLPGNSIGFESSPVNLSNLSTSTYSNLKLKANFQTNSTSETPILYDWQLSWRTSLPTPIGNATFQMRGEKLIGKDASENPIYKFSTTTQTDSDGQKNLSNLEWDDYYFSVPAETNLDLISIEPSQPVSLPPDTSSQVNLYLRSQNSLLVTVQDLDTLQPIFSATTTLTGTSYQKTQYTNEKGQTLFIPLESQSYNLSVEASGYSSTSTTVFVSGDNTVLIKLKISD